MNTQEAICATAETSRMVLNSYISDLDDADLMRRPGPSCNHLAWQLGHLIASECDLLESVKPGAAIVLPDGFAEQHATENVGIDDPSKFCTKAEYVELLDKVHQASLAAIKQTTDAELDAPAPEKFREYFPTAGNIYVLIATHAMMHAGQFVPVRRALDKPILM